MKTIRDYVAEQKQLIKDKIATLTEKPSLMVIHSGNDQASAAYMRGKKKDCEEVGIEYHDYEISDKITDQLYFNGIVSRVIFERDKEPTGVIVQLPLPNGLHSPVLPPSMDADGFGLEAIVNPATPQGIVDYLTDQGFDFVNKNVTIIGRSAIVGKPLANMLIDLGSNVTVINSHTDSFNKYNALYGADLIVCATGHRNTLTDEDIVSTHKDCIIIDVGINRNDEGKLCGDCENVTLREKTPVPGGVGLLTRLALLKNVMKLYEN